MRGADGRPRSERFDDAAAYRARLARLQTNDGAVSLDEILRLFDA